MPTGKAPESPQKARQHAYPLFILQGTLNTPQDGLASYALGSFQGRLTSFQVWLGIIPRPFRTVPLWLTPDSWLPRPGRRKADRTFGFCLP